MTINTMYITTNTLEPVFLDKNTGLPLANGTVEFWQDDNRVVPKAVFELSGAPPNYTFTALPNPINLSSIGTLQDAAGNNIAIYYYPYDNVTPIPNQQLYYVVVRDQFGNLNFTREAWPNTGILGSSTTPTGMSSGTLENMISNPQFVDVNFGSPSILPRTGSFSYTGLGTDIYQIAPGWEMQVTHSGNGAITLEQAPIEGVVGAVTNPPFGLGVTAGANITSLLFRQKLSNDPSIWASTNNFPSFVNGGALFSAGTYSMNYVPNSAVPSSTTIFLQNIVAPSPQVVYFNQTVQIPASINANDGNTGYVAIEISTPITGQFIITSVQVVGLSSNITSLPFQQLTTARQIDHLFNYYNPLLQYKPIPNLLTAWDFPFNPAQFLGDTVPASVLGADNKSKYVWDQTIIFQGIDNSIGVSRSIDGSIVLTPTTPTQMAIVQYQPQTEARKILFNPICVNIVADTTVSQSFTVSLWYTKDVSLPSMATNNSLVATLDTNGKPATFNGNWLEVPRGTLGNAVFSTDGNGGFETFSLTGWQLLTGDVHLATFFAIVIGTDVVASSNAVVFNSINMCAGQIPTIPAPQSASAVLSDCQRYYEKSFDVSTPPQQALGLNTGEYFFTQIVAAGAPQFFDVWYKVSKFPKNGIIITLYNPVSANAQMRNESTNADNTLTVSNGNHENSFFFISTMAIGSASGNILGMHWSSDARLGF